ncbi:hypothetical protein SAMN06298216_1105 [Spirosomataceae bacterium TFI 002]|nr:hypothetical protein SAMN06298216_1105 [Spirosomataceae bacterium TFI 002]
MRRIFEFIKIRKLAFYVSASYVGFGTISVCSVYPADLFHGEWTWIGLLVTFPVSIVSAGYRYADSQRLYPVFLIQAIIFISLFLALGEILKKK